MKFKKRREKFFKKIYDNFENEIITSLLVSHKINKILFNKLKKSVVNYFNQSKNFDLINKTPNGFIIPKIEVESEYNSVVISYCEVLSSMNLINLIEFLPFPVVRYKKSNFDPDNYNRKSRSELPHSDAWAGWNINSVLVNIPIFGDTIKNRVVFYKHPDDFDEDWLKKTSFEKAQNKFVNKCKLVNHHYKKGYIYIADISVIHQTSRIKNSKDRISIDTPIILSNTTSNKLRSRSFSPFGEIQGLHRHQIPLLGKKKLLKCTNKMGEISKKNKHFDLILVDK